MESLEGILSSANAAGQDHLFQNWNQRSPEEQEEFLESVKVKNLKESTHLKKFIEFGL